MSEYRDEIRSTEKELRWTFFRVLPLILIVVVVLFVIAFGLQSIGLIGKTAVEREVFEQSYQRTESLKSQIATMEASLAEIEIKLTNTNLDNDTRFNLEAQASAIRIRINSARSQLGENNE